MNGSEALLQFAGNQEIEAGVFDGANVSPEELQQINLTESIRNASWGGLDLHGRRLVGASIRSANLSQANLTGADLTDAVCSGIDLSSARLESACLIRTDLVGANLRGVNAGEADFTDALLEDARMTGAQMRFANFGRAILDGADFSDADLWGSKFLNSAADRVVFRNARLDESSLIDADLSGADFSSATLRRADLAQARLQNSNLRDATLEGANLAGANLSGAILPNLSLSSCNLNHAYFAGAWLERTRMRARQLGGQVGEESSGNFEAAIDSYVVLERNFLSLGISEDASWAYLRRRRVGRKLHWKQAEQQWQAGELRAALRAGTLWLADCVAEWLCDYGESLYRVARAFLLILLTFAILYWLTGSLRMRDGFSGMHVWNPVNYLLFSLDSMTTVGTSEVALRPAGELGILLSSLQTVLGTILLGLFGFVLGARIRN